VAHHGRAEPSVHTLDDVTALIDQIVNLYDGSNWRKTNARLQGGYLTKWTSSAKVFVYSTFAAIARPVPSTTTQFYLVTDEFEPLHEFFSELLRTLTIGQRQPTRFLVRRVSGLFGSRKVAESFMSLPSLTLALSKTSIKRSAK